MNAEEYLMQALAEFNDKEVNPDKSIAVYRRTIKAMQEFAEMKCKEQRDNCVSAIIDEDYGFCDKYKLVGGQARYHVLHAPLPKF